VQEHDKKNLALPVSQHIDFCIVNIFSLEFFSSDSKIK
jgi:hypothetical protein